MTTDGPKVHGRAARSACNCGPCQHEAAERSAPIPYLRRHVAEAIYDAVKIYNKADVDKAADAVVGMVQPGLERLTFERDAAQATLNYATEFLSDLLEDYGLSRPENLAGALDQVGWALHLAVWLNTESRWMLRSMARRVGEWRRTSDKHYAEFYQAVEDWGRNDEAMLAKNQRLADEASRLREQLAAPPHVPLDASNHVFAALERVTGVHTGSQLGDQTDAVMDLLKSWGVSSSEVEAPKPRVWRDRAGDLWRELGEARRVAVLIEWEGRPYDGVPVLLSDIRESHGPLTEVLSCTEQEKK